MFGWDEEERTDSVPHDRFDAASWNEMRMESIALEKMVEALSQKHDYVEDFTQDVFNLLLKSVPRVRETMEMAPSHVALRGVVADLQNLGELKELREFTVSDSFNAMMALNALRPVLEDALSRAEKLAEQAQEAQDALDAAKEAAEQDPGSEAAEEAAEAAAQAMQALEVEAQAGNAPARAAMRRAVQEAADDAAQTEATARSYGMDPGEMKRMSFEERLALAKRLSGEKLRRFADLIGQFKTMAAAEWRRRYTDGADEVVGLKLGDDLTRLSGQEMLNLASPELEDDFWMRYADRTLLVKDFRTRERVAKGPIIVIGDESATMDGQREAWAKGITLALLDQAHRGKRDFHYIGFGSRMDALRRFEFPGGRTDPKKVIELAEGFINGGTDFNAPLVAATEIIQSYDLERPDVVFITDGDAPAPMARHEWKLLRDRLSVVCHGIQIEGRPTGVLEEISTSVRSVTDLLDVTQVADILRS